MAVITRYGEEKTRVARQPAVRWMAAARPPGLVASTTKRQGVGACAAPAPLPPRAPRQVPGFITARRRRGGTTPSAYAAQAARSIHGENSPRDIRGRTAGKRDHGEAGHARQGWTEAGRMVQPEKSEPPAKRVVCSGPIRAYYRLRLKTLAFTLFKPSALAALTTP